MPPGEFSDVIAAHDGPVEENEFDPVEGWETGSTGSTSVTSSIYEHEYAHGRRYHSFKNGRYPIPNDDIEQNREDMKHAMMLELTDGKLFYSPIGINPQKIIDIGTGTGIWAIEAGELFPSATVLGIDLSPIQPIWVPSNVKFLVDDAEDDWLHGDQFDLVHFRTMTSVLKNTPRTIANTYAHIKKGGWIELQELHPWPRCDDGTMTADDTLKRLYEYVEKSFAAFGMNLHGPEAVGQHLEAAGFRNIRCIVKKVPVGTWARDPRLRIVGYYMMSAIEAIVPSLCEKPLAALGMSPEERQVWAAVSRKTLKDNSRHRYFNFYFWYAQK